MTRGPLRLLVLGDSIAYGTGARLLEDTIGRRLVRSLKREGYDASLHVLAVPGATTRDLAAQVRRAASLGADLALIVVGANDLTRLIPPAQSAAALGTAVTALRAANVRVVVVPAPDLSDLPFVPHVARPWVHQACAQLQRRQTAAAESAGAVIAPISADLARAFAADARLFSPDRYHPSSAGYASIAEAIDPYLLAAARSCTEVLQPEH